MGLFSKQNVVAFKDSNVCVLRQMIGRNEEFYNEFSNITKQGYELKSIYSPAGSFLASSGTPEAWCYFQKQTLEKS